MGVFFGFLFGVLLLGAVGVAIWFFYKKSSKKGKNTLIGGIVSAVVALGMLICFIFVPFGFQQVETGQIAVVKVWGEAKEIKGAGLHFRNVVSDKYEIYDLKTQQMNINNEVYTKDAQPLRIEITMQYSILADKVLDINKAYGDMEILATRIEKIAIEKAKVILSSETAMGLIETRAAISPKLFTEIKTIESQYFITVENVVIVDMAFSEAFENAVEQKMIAQQEVIKAEAEKEKAVIKAQQDLEVAKLKAQEVIEAADGDAQALKIMQAAWDELTAEVKEAMLRQLMLEKWDGVLPQVMTGEELLVMFGLK